MKKLLFFINPNAGQCEIRDCLMDVAQIFAANGYRISLYPTQAPGELAEVIAREGADYDVVVSVGGDGTLNETTRGLMQLPEGKRPVIGYLPGGTVNDVARTLGLSRSARRAAEQMVTGRPYAMDVGSFNSGWFNYVAAFGAFTDVSYRTSQEDKRMLGRLAYLLDGTKSLTEIRPIEVEITVNGETRQETVLIGLVTSTTSVGGFAVKGMENVRLDDGLFEVLLIREIRTAKNLSNVVSGLLKQDFSGEEFFFTKAERVEFRFSKETDWTLDGEFGGRVTEAIIQNHKQAVSILVPAKA